MQSRMAKVLITVGVVAGGVSLLVYSSLGQAEYSHDVDELMEAPEDWRGQSLRVNGFVEPGSIEEEVVDQTLAREFVLEYEGESIVVRHQGPAPDTFRDLSEVVAMGELVEEDGAYVLEADDLTAKCPSKYEGQRPPSEYGDSPEPSLDGIPDEGGGADGY